MWLLARFSSDGDAAEVVSVGGDTQDDADNVSVGINWASAGVEAESVQPTMARTSRLPGYLLLSQAGNRIRIDDGFCEAHAWRDVSVCDASMSRLCDDGTHGIRECPRTPIWPTRRPRSGGRRGSRGFAVGRWQVARS